ncbi:NAD(P)H-binding protein [Campylobacter concisus]|uniref:NAD(P)H-binding protein n=1 Tax=Campylobacter concisus TaxID=199 RepID=UPI001884406B|nr:NAD(P)H-binding protein [Campylobacter concisus]MBE9851646.1 NAD(P)H-binding protein [Campylobacter concisus]
MKILLLGASGSLGGYVIEELLRVDGVNLRLYARDIKKLEKFKSDSTELIQGDAEDEARLVEALSGVNAVYAGLAGSLEMMASTLVSAMKKSGVKRVVWITSYGIYAGEVPSGARAPSSYINSAKIIENSGLDYTLIRPQWFSKADEIDYEVTSLAKGEKFKNENAQISRKSIANLVKGCLVDSFGIKDSLGINKKEI